MRRSDSGDKMVQLLLKIKEFSDENHFHLSGINIFLTEFQCHLGSRACFFIPQDADSRLASGSRNRYDSQLARFGSLSAPDPRLEFLISLIHKHHRGYDQEGFI